MKIKFNLHQHCWHATPKTMQAKDTTQKHDKFPSVITEIYSWEEECCKCGKKKTQTVFGEKRSVGEVLTPPNSF